MNPNKNNEELVDPKDVSKPSFTKWLTEITSSLEKNHIMPTKHRVFCFTDKKPEIPFISTDIPSRLTTDTNVQHLGENDKRRYDSTKYGKRSIVTQMYFENTSRNISLTSSDYLVPRFEGIDFNELKTKDSHQIALENSWKRLNDIQFDKKSGKDRKSSQAFGQIMAEVPERTFIMVKPDGVQRGLVGKIIKRFEAKGFKLVALKFVWPSEDLLRKHYADLSTKPFFPSLINYMSSGPVVPMVWEGLNVVKTGRVLLGATNPADSAPGTIRGDLCIQTGRNIIHGSDAVESAKKEIDLWFTEKEVIDWKPAAESWVYEN